MACAAADANTRTNANMTAESCMNAKEWLSQREKADAGIRAGDESDGGA